MWSVDGSILEAEIPDIGFIKKERNLLDSKQKRLERRNVRTEVVEDFCEEVSQNFHQLLIDSCNLVVPDEILGYLLESGFADPRFNLATGSSREKILKRMSLKQRLSPKSSVLIFRLPKILTTYQLNQEELSIS